MRCKGLECQRGGGKPVPETGFEVGVAVRCDRGRRIGGGIVVVVEVGPVGLQDQTAV